MSQLHLVDAQDGSISHGQPNNEEGEEEEKGFRLVRGLGSVHGGVGVERGIAY